MKQKEATNRAKAGDWGLCDKRRYSRIGRKKHYRLWEFSDNQG